MLVIAYDHHYRQDRIRVGTVLSIYKRTLKSIYIISVVAGVTMLDDQKIYWMYKAEMSLDFSLTKKAKRSNSIAKWPTDAIFILFHEFHGIKFHKRYSCVKKAL